jgi:hypothetical protein
MADIDDKSLEGIYQLTETVKSRILDRVIADLRRALKLGTSERGYTKSDSGIYGKYEKCDPVDLGAVLDAIKAETDRLLAESVANARVCSNEEDDSKTP